MSNKTYFFHNFKLLDIRLWFHIVAFFHLFVTAIVTLSVDPSVDQDVRVKAYIHLRWKLLTCWYNMITLGYLPICVYCGLQEKRGLGYLHHVQRLRYLTDVVMTGILFPVTMYGGILFWVLMNIDVNLLAPPRLFDYMPYWCQHSLHSVSIAVVVMDISLTPRTRPKSLAPRFFLATGFSAIYTFMLCISHFNGDIVYNFLNIFSAFQNVMFTILSYVLFSSFYFIQWKIIDFVWSPKLLKAVFKEKL